MKKLSTNPRFHDAVILLYCLIWLLGLSPVRGCIGNANTATEAVSCLGKGQVRRHAKSKAGGKARSWHRTRWPVVYAEIYGIFGMMRNWVRIDLEYRYDGQHVEFLGATVGAKHPLPALYTDIAFNYALLSKEKFRSLYVNGIKVDRGIELVDVWLSVSYSAWFMAFSGEKTENYHFSIGGNGLVYRQSKTNWGYLNLLPYIDTFNHPDSEY